MQLDRALYFAGQTRKLWVKDDAVPFATGAASQERTYSFKIAGGVVLLVISVRMILEDIDDTAAADDKELHAVSSSSLRNLAVFPLATPLIAGPGGILVVVLLTDNYKHDILEQTVSTLMLLVVMVFTCLVLLTGESIQRHLGEPLLHLGNCS